jgi:4-amino-4-deoxy-L-arabinose transferase-like glycosyltransferase
MRSHTPPTTDQSRRTTLLLYGGAAVFIIAVHLATNGVLGFHIDELYYLACGRHLAFGYVDFPPVVPLLARLETTLLGVTPWTLRLLPALFGGVNVILCGAYVRKLGGSLHLQALALLIGMTAPDILGTWLFQTVIFDQVTWMVSLYLFLSLAIEPKPRTWLLLGLTLGIGLEVKYTIAALIAGIGLAVLLTPALRAQLRTAYPWLAALLTLVIWAPNLLWQIVEGFPSLSYILNHHGDVQSGGGSAVFVVDFLLLLLLLTPLWIAGFIALFRNRVLRAIGIACAVPLIVFLVAGKFYYAAPTIPIVMAAGLLAVSQVTRRARRSALAIAVALASLLGCIALLQIILPITPATRLHATGLDTKNSDFASTVGWVPITNQLTVIYGDLSPAERTTTVIISSDYGVAGALQIYGHAKLLPASFSPQLSDFFWLPTRLAATEALMVGYQPADVDWMCTSAQVVAHLTVPYQVVNLEQGAPVTYCRLKGPIPSIWGRLQNYS